METEVKVRKSLEEVHGSVDTSKGKSHWRRLLAFSGPAFLVSVGYMDPGNWATDIAGGSRYGYALIWVLLMSNLIAILLQSLSARLGLVRGQDLAQASRETYPRAVNFVLYVLAEIAIAACDLAEVLGMAIGLNLLFGLPLIAGVIISVLDTFLIMVLQNYGMRKMEAFIVSMIAIIALSFLGEIIFSRPDVASIVNGFVPSLPDSSALYIAIGIIGATVMPHNLYLHSALVQTRSFRKDSNGIKNAIRYNFVDSAVALNMAFFVNAAILIVAGTVFFNNQLYHVADIQDAHKLLEPILGNTLAPALFAIALIAAGQSSTVTGTLAGQIVMEGYLNLRIRIWLRRLITRLVAIAPAFVTLIIWGDKSVGGLLILSQVVLSLQLGFAIIPLIHLVSDREKMREFAIRTWVKIASWVSAFIIVSLNVKLVVDEIGGWLITAGENRWIYQVTVIPAAIALGLLLMYITISPVFKRRFQASEIPHGSAGEKLDFSTPVYRKIAVAVDFSDSDQKTISHALLHGGKSAEYLLMHVVETAGAKVMGEEIMDFETYSDTDSLNKYAQILSEKGYNVTPVLGFGQSDIKIPKIIERYGADLLVMGSHGHKKIMGMIFGETAHPVQHRVAIPVLVIN